MSVHNYTDAMLSTSRVWTQGMALVRSVASFWEGEGHPETMYFMDTWNDY